MDAPQSWGGGDIYDMIDSMHLPVQYPMRRMLWRGKCFGTSVTTAQWTAIGNGTFKGMFVGDYWEIGGRIYRIMDFNYWLGTGDTECTTNHLVIVPDKNLYLQRMHSSDTTTMGYNGSEMKSSGLNSAKSTINSAFGSAHILSHRELFTNASSNGAPSGGSWYDSTIEIPTEIQFYGTNILGAVNMGATVSYKYDVNKSQLAGFQANPKMICPHRENNWLRDIVSGANFAIVGSVGGAYGSDASASSGGVRPVFGIKG